MDRVLLVDQGVSGIQLDNVLVVKGPVAICRENVFDKYLYFLSL